MFFIGFPLPENQFCVNFSTALYFLMIEEPRGKPGGWRALSRFKMIRWESIAIIIAKKTIKQVRLQTSDSFQNGIPFRDPSFRSVDSLDCSE